MDRKILRSILLSQIILFFILPLNINCYTLDKHIYIKPLNADLNVKSILAEILVESDVDFIAYSFPGNGTKENPY